MESRRAADSRACYLHHSHPTLSIGAVDRGTSRLTVGDEVFALTAGMVVLIPADCVHACNPDPGAAWSYQMLYLDSSWVAALLTEIPANPEVLGRPGILADAGVYQHFCDLNEALSGTGEPEDKEAALIEFLGRMLAGAADIRHPARVRAPSPRLAEIQALLVEHCDEAWPLERLAGAAGMSRFHFIRAFRQTTGMTPHAFLLDARINRAKALLRKGQPLADVALELQFADQSHFQRVFRKRVAATPAEYARGAISSNTGRD